MSFSFPFLFGGGKTKKSQLFPKKRKQKTHLRQRDRPPEPGDDPCGRQGRAVPCRGRDDEERLADSQGGGGAEGQGREEERGRGRRRRRRRGGRRGRGRRRKVDSKQGDVRSRLRANDRGRENQFAPCRRGALLPPGPHEQRRARRGGEGVRRRGDNPSREHGDARAQRRERLRGPPPRGEDADDGAARRGDGRLGLFLVEERGGEGRNWGEGEEEERGGGEEEEEVSPPRR